MKTGMEWPLLGLVLLIALALAAQAWSAAQVDLAATQVQVLAVGQSADQKLPSGWLEFGELGVSWIVKAAVGATLTGLGLAVGYKGWEWFQVRKTSRPWQPGPNAYYQPAPRLNQARIPSEAELWRLAALQQMTSNGTAPQGLANRSTAIRTINDDEPDITF